LDAEVSLSGSRAADTQEVIAGISDSDVDSALDSARAGDGRGFDVLFRATSASVVGYLRSRNVSDPDGVANEVFLRVFRSIHTFAGDGERFRSWLFTIAHNAAIDDARRRRRRINETPLDNVVDPVGGDVEDDIDASLAHDRVEALLDRLSPDQREVIALRIVADLSVDQTAAVLDKSYEAVKALQRRGLASLRRALSDQQVVSR
jgi:RNA polymerase sigma-70 factor (ECF subfamily)